MHKPESNLRGKEERTCYSKTERTGNGEQGTGQRKNSTLSYTLGWEKRKKTNRNLGPKPKDMRNRRFTLGMNEKQDTLITLFCFSINLFFRFTPCLKIDVVSPHMLPRIYSLAGLYCANI